MGALPIKLLIVLTAVYDGVMYIARPSESISGSIVFSQDPTRYNLKSDVLHGLNVYSVSLSNVTRVPSSFKVKFHYPSHDIETSWQTIGHDPHICKLPDSPTPVSCIVVVSVAIFVLVIFAIFLIVYVVIYLLNLKV